MAKKKAKAATTGTKHDQGKLRYDLVPALAMGQFVAVVTFGAQKYADNNWRQVTPRMRYVGAALRHIFSWLGGERFDKETGLSHLAHAVCCLMFLLEYEPEVWAEKLGADK